MRGFLYSKGTTIDKLTWLLDITEVTQCYLPIPSYSSLDKFPNDTLTEYRVGLLQTVSFTGDWELALTEVHYPHSWSGIAFKEIFIIDSTYGKNNHPEYASHKLFHRIIIFPLLKLSLGVYKTKT